MTKLSMSTTRVKFGDVAINSTTVSADPEAEGFDRYIIGKHIPEDADRIETWGPVGDSDFGPRIRTIFQPGDVICTTRGPKLKVARVDFRGLGAHTNFYLRTADPEVLLQPYLEAVVRSNGFQQHLVNNFRGSVNLFVNWSDAAKYEFPLPPLEEQRRVAEVLQAANSSLESLLKLELRLTEMFSSLLEELLSNGLEDSSNQEINGIQYPASWPMQPLSELASVERGKFSHRPRNLPEFFGGPYPFVQTGDIASSTGDLGRASKYLSEEGIQYSRSFSPGTILITIAAIIGETAITNCETWAPDSVVGITPSEAIDVRFLEYVLRRLQPQLDGELATKSTQKNINLGILKPLQIPCPDIDTQRDICRQLRAVENGVREVNERISSLRRLNAQILRSTLAEERGQ